MSHRMSRDEFHDRHVEPNDLSGALQIAKAIREGLRQIADAINDHNDLTALFDRLNSMEGNIMAAIDDLRTKVDELTTKVDVLEAQASETNVTLGELAELVRNSGANEAAITEIVGRIEGLKVRVAAAVAGQDAAEEAADPTPDNPA